MTIVDHDCSCNRSVPRSARMPGIILAAMLAALGFGLHTVPWIGVLSPMTLSIFLGIAFRNLIGLPASAPPGVGFSMRHILRLAIVLLGLQLTAHQTMQVGGVDMAIIVVSMLVTFLATKLLGRLLGINSGLAELIAAGTSVCGASAIVAVNTVTNAPDEDVAYAVACVAIFGSIAMFLYPALSALVHLSPRAYGLWSGASIHEIAQVVAAAFQHGPIAGEFGTVAKLTRVSMLAPLVLTLSLVASRGKDNQPARKVPMPWFVLGFIALAGLNSIVTIPASIKASIVAATAFLLSVALAAMGLETDLRKLAGRGFRPAALGALASLFIATLSLGLIKAFT